MLEEQPATLLHPFAFFLINMLDLEFAGLWAQTAVRDAGNEACSC